MRILVADDHDLVRDAICTLLLSGDASLKIEKASDFSGTLDLIRAKGLFDILLLDVCMPGMNGLNGPRRLLNEFPAAKIILMSGQLNADDIGAATELGIKGFVPKTQAGRALLNALRLVDCGETYIPAALTAVRAGSGGALRLRASLTERERDVLGQLRQGNSNREIANLLAITESTVKLHLRALSDKLAARNRTDIVIRAIEAGIA